MGSIDAALEAGEQVVYRTRLHPVAVASNAGLVTAVAGVVALVVVRNELALGTVALLCLAGTLVALAAVAPGYLRWRGTELAVTSRRVIARMSRRGLHAVVPAAVEVHRDRWGRWLDYGLVRILDADGTVSEFHPVRQPEALARAVKRLAPPPGRRR